MHLSQSFCKLLAIDIEFPNHTKQSLISKYFLKITDDHLLITNLRPSTTYTVVVEARKMEKYSDIDEGVCK